MQVVRTPFKGHSAVKCGRLSWYNAFNVEVMAFIMLVLGLDTGLLREVCSSTS